MPDKTTNYHLTKPFQQDGYQVDVVNASSDIIDAELKRNADDVSAKLDKPAAGTWVTGNSPQYTASGGLADSGQKITDKANKARVIALTLAAASWSNGQYTISRAEILADSPGDVKLAVGATDAQFDAFQEANLRVVTQVAGKIVLKVGGITPLIAIPIVLEVRS